MRTLPSFAGPACLVLFLLFVLGACSSAPHSPQASGPQPLLVYGWDDAAPGAVLSDFTAATGIPVHIVSFANHSEAVLGLAGGVVLDVALVDNYEIQALKTQGLLSPISQHQLPNFRNVTPSFRSLSFDPENRYSVPFSWGTNGVIARADLVRKPIDQWSDLWDPVYCRRIIVWDWQQRILIGGALRSLGYSANSEDPGQLAAARKRLLALRPCVVIMSGGDSVTEHFAALVSGQLMMGIGSAHEAYFVRDHGFAAGYYFPTDGPLLWGQSLVIPVTAAQQEAAELFIDYLLRPKVAAQFTNANYFRVANDAAEPQIARELRADATIFPPTDTLRNAEMLLALSAEGEQLYAQLWAEFLNAQPEPQMPQ